MQRLFSLEATTDIRSGSVSGQILRSAMSLACACYRAQSLCHTAPARVQLCGDNMLALHGDAPVSTVERVLSREAMSRSPPRLQHIAPPPEAILATRTLGDDRDVPLVEEPFPQLVRLVELPLQPQLVPLVKL